MFSGSTVKKMNGPLAAGAVYNDNLAVVKSNASIHYVGQNQSMTDRLSVYFEQVTENKSLLQVFNRMQDDAGFATPVVILFDLPVQLDELQRMFAKLRSGNNKLLICCNASHLQNYDVHQVKSLNIIDDVFDFDDEKLPLQKRIQFLLKAAGAGLCRQTAPQPSKGKGAFLLKRLLDCIIAGILLLILSPVMALIALIILWESGAPVFYSQPRVGRGYRVFRFFKFRTMVPDADKQVEQLSAKNLYVGKGTGPRFFKIENDPRITPVGRFLRNSSLDELPQLFNVLRGDMSIVGNRPLPLYEAETLTSNDCVERFCAPAGITGLWQVTKRGRPEMTVEERVRLDIEYARQVCPILDFKILMATPKALFQKSNV